jgi:uncharacterized heparinase superfamily protein
VRWHFHLAPGVSAARAGDTTVLLAAGAARWQLKTPANLAIEVQPAAYSPSYGVKVPCVAIDLSSQVDLGGERTWEFSIVS